MFHLNTLLFRSEGLQVGGVGSDGKVDLRSVSARREFGQTVEMVVGVAPADRVVINPDSSLMSGITVRLADVSPTAEST